VKRQFGSTQWHIAPLGLALRAARTALICGEFGSTIERMLGEALATGCELLWLDIPPARDDIAFGNAAAPFDSATADVWKWVGAAVRTARAADHVITTASLAPITAGALEVAFPVEFVQRRVEQVLTATELDAVPLVQLQVAAHHTRADRYWGELQAALQRMTREGKVMHWGLAVAPPPRQPVRRPDRERQSDHDEFVDDFPDLLRDDVFAALTVPFHLFGQSAARWLPATTELKRAVIAQEPLCRGALVGEIGATTKFHRFDPRAQRWSSDDLHRMAIAVARLAQSAKQLPPAVNSCDEARAVVGQWQQARSRNEGIEPETTSVLELALRFVISAAPLHTVVGARTAEQWRAALIAADPRPLPVNLQQALVLA
jgi:aryl-alcohol dehydrogenase-like predicted oxidoreductase